MILGVDPGSRWIGWAAMSDSGRLVGAGVLDLEQIDARGIVRALRSYLAAGSPASRLVGVETVEAVGHRPGFGPRMAGDLVRAARLGGKIVQAFTDDGVLVKEPTAEEVRSHFFGRPVVDGAAVKALVRERIAGWPKVSNGHARDAAAVALYVGRAA